MALPHPLSGHLAQEDWSHFIDCVNAQMETGASDNTKTSEGGNAATDMKAYVAEWNAEFFQSRGLQISLRRSGDPVADTSIDRTFALSPPTVSVPQSNTSLPLLSEPLDGWTSKKAAAARASGKKVDEKLERERQKHEAHINAIARKAQKAAQKLESSVRKQEAKTRRREGKSRESIERGDSKDADAMQFVDEADERSWELVLQPL